MEKYVRGYDDALASQRYMTPTTASGLADALVALAVEQLERAQQSFAPGFALPRIFGGHVVGPDARADLAFTMGLLFEAGVTEVDGVAIEPVIVDILTSLDGPGTHSFYSYRAAETVERLGGWYENPRLAGLTGDQRAELEQAMDSSSFVELIEKDQLPNNYKIVISRCEEARRRLGLPVDANVADDLLERSRKALAQADSGWIDDSNDGRGQFDIYTADMFLFAEPMADDLGDVWTDGFRRVVADVAHLAMPGGAVVWGRSVGALGIAMTIELGAVSIARGLSGDVSGWLARAEHALAELAPWFDRQGVLGSHVNRSTMFYRGPDRRLQMTYDILGKLLQAAAELRRAVDTDAIDGSIGAGVAFPATDTFVPMRSAGDAGAWVHRGAIDVVVPLVAAWSSDYLASPRSPGLLEQPTSGPACMVPVMHRSGTAMMQTTVPSQIDHRPNSLSVTGDTWQELGGVDNPDAEFVDGSRTVRFEVDGRTLAVHEHLTIDVDPASIDALSITVPEVPGRRLNVDVTTSHPYRLDRVDVSGLAEWRSFWGPIDAVHQIDIEPAREVELVWEVTPFPKVGSTIHGHQYNESLYGPLRDRVDDVAFGGAHLDDVAALAGIDVLHCHWPEWLTGVDPERTAAVLANIKRAGLPVLWTMHNLEPHFFKTADARACYQLWAQAADVLIHHTEWGKAKALDTYEFGADTQHHVIPHGHWGASVGQPKALDRAVIETQHALPPCAIRLGVVGAPRAEKDVQLVLDAFAATDRDDLQLCVFSRADELVPDDPRIHTWAYRLEPGDVYNQRLHVIDVLVLPFDRGDGEGGMLMTGTAFDAIGAGKASLLSEWPVLHEVFGDAGIRYGSTQADLTATMQALTVEQVAADGAAALARQTSCEWSASVEATLALIEDLACR